MKAYDGRFKDIFQKVFDEEFKEKFCQKVEILSPLLKKTKFKNNKIK